MKNKKGKRPENSVDEKRDPNLDLYDPHKVTLLLRKESSQAFNSYQQTIYLNGAKEIVMKLFIETLASQKILPSGYCLSYYFQDRKIYVYCGFYSDKDQFSCHDIPFEQAVNAKNQIQIKLRPAKRSLKEMLLEEQDQKSKIQDAKDPASKERKISEVIQKVALWRRLYTGFRDDNGKIVQESLEQAAVLVRISKKTLDDYLLQIRCGKKYGYDFNAHKDQNIGHLRAFVRKKKDEKKDVR